MFTKPSQVIIGKKVNIADPQTLEVGDITVVDENMHVASTDNPTEHSAVYVGVCTAIEDGVRIIKWSDKLSKGDKFEYNNGNAEDPTNAKIEINLANAEIVKGHRYVLRVLYKDIEAANLQFTHTYEVIATSELVDDLGNAFLKKINAHKNRRVNVTYAGSKLTLTAKDKNYDNSINALDEYSIVAMQVALYVTIPGALLSNQPEKVAGVEITKTEGKPGKGFWKQVRDAERRAMGYKGHVFTGAYPSVEQEMMTVKGAKYNYITVANEKSYLSPDNQYTKTTPVLTEIYCEGSLGFVHNIIFLGLISNVNPL